MSKSLKSLMFAMVLGLALLATACGPMSRNVVAPQNAPEAVGPYSQGIVAGGLVFTSGQLPLIPGSNTMPEGIEAQAVQSLENVKAVLEAGGSSMDNVVKVTIFLKNLNDFGTVNSIYGTYFKENYPARSCVQVARIPRDALIEIEAVGVVVEAKE